MNIRTYYKKDALLAYIDLLGTSILYKEDKALLQKQAERLFRSLIEHFDTEFENMIGRDNRVHFNVNVYADSIMIYLKSNEDHLVVKLIQFLLKFQWVLIFEQGSEIGPVPFMAQIDQQPFFSIRVDSVEEWSIMQPEFTTCSLCGGKGLIKMDENLRKLPVGVYISGKLKDRLSDKVLQGRCVPVKGADLYFIKQDDRQIDFLFLPVVQGNLTSHIEGSTLEEILKNLFSEGMTKYQETKWRQWIDVHESTISEISRINDE
jgi:hypothetical protein